MREPWEFEVAKIAGSKHIPMGDIPARFNQELDPEEHIVVVCHHGVRSMNVTAWLRQQGFEKVQSLRGGIDRWSRQVDPGAGLLREFGAIGLRLGAALLAQDDR